MNPEIATTQSPTTTHGIATTQSPTTTQPTQNTAGRVRRLAVIGNDGRRFTLKPLPSPRRRGPSGRPRVNRRLGLVG